MTDFFLFVGYFLLLINFFLFLRGFSNQGKAFKIFTIYLFGIFVIQITAYVFKIERINNLFISHFYFIFQLIIISLFYHNLLKEKYQRKIIQISFLLCIVSLLILYLVNPSLFFEFNLFEVFITSFLLIIYSTFHLYNQLDSKREYYYINLGILIYLFGSTILFLVGNLMLSFKTELNKITWNLNACLYIVYQLFILYEWKISFSKNKKQQNEF